MKFHKRVLALAVSAGLCLSVNSDDTEIFFNGTDEVDSAPPMVMFSLDWRPNLGSTVCSDYAASGCEETMGDEIYEELANQGAVAGEKVTLFDTYRAIFQIVFDEISGFSIGFMLNHGNADVNKSTPTNGGYILRGFELIDKTADGIASKDEILERIFAIPADSSSSGHDYQGAELFFEFYRYLTGGEVLNGHKGYKSYDSANPGGTPSLNLNDPNNLNKAGDPISTLVSWDTQIENVAGTEYISPYEGTEDFSCARVYTINILFQVSQQEDDSKTEMAKDYTQGGLEIGGNPDFVDVITRLNQIDHAQPDAGVGVNVSGVQNVTSYFIVSQVNTKTRGYAQAGGTEDPIDASEDPKQLLEEIRKIFNQIAAVTSSFVSVSVPVNVQNRTQSLPELFLAQFRPDDTGNPFWPGNVKKLNVEIDPDTQVVEIRDSLGQLAFNPVTGRIDDGALTYWTDSAGRDVAEDELDDDGEVLIEAGKDGSSVIRGGSGQKIPGYLGDDVGANNSGERQVFIEPAILNSPTRTALLPLNADTLDSDATIQKLLGILNDDDTENTDLIADIESASGVDPLTADEATEKMLQWVRGVDVFDWDADDDDTDARPWVMGDVLHSRPLVLNYGGSTDSTQDVRIVFGSNSGLLHMVQSKVSGVDSGVENWAFMPREMLSNVSEWIKRTNVGIDRPYGVDGTPTALIIDNNDNGLLESSRSNDGTCSAGDDNCDKAYVYTGLRRGGKSYYALDMSSKDNEPSILWRVQKGDTGYEEMGLSFSDPRIGFVRFETVDGLNKFDERNVPIATVMVGGGYYGGPGDSAIPGGDAFDYSDYVGYDNFDYQATAADPAEEGNAVYLIHARTGELVWKVTQGSADPTDSEFQHPDMIHSIPGSITPVPSLNENGIIDIAYAADVGGNIWRLDMPRYDENEASPDPDHRANKWFATKVASLGGTGSSDRRFFHAMTVVRGEDSIGRYLGLVIGSGDRAHPRSQTGVENHMYLIKDRSITAGDVSVKSRAAITTSDLLDVTNMCLNDSDIDDDAGNECSPESLENGWLLKLEDTGEKNLSIPLVSAGKVFFTTYVPEGGEDLGQCAPDIGFSRLYQINLRDASPFTHLSGTADDVDFSKDDRSQDLASGIDGGVTPVTPNEALTSSGKKVTIGEQTPEVIYWSEKGIDILDKD